MTDVKEEEIGKPAGPTFEEGGLRSAPTAPAMGRKPRSLPAATKDQRQEWSHALVPSADHPDNLSAIYSIYATAIQTHRLPLAEMLYWDSMKALCPADMRYFPAEYYRRVPTWAMLSSAARQLGMPFLEGLQQLEAEVMRDRSLSAMLQMTDSFTEDQRPTPSDMRLYGMHNRNHNALAKRHETVTGGKRKKDEDTQGGNSAVERKLDRLLAKMDSGDLVILSKAITVRDAQQEKKDGT